jgi:hypothetical protein
MDKDGENVWKSAEFANAINSLLENKLNHIRLITANSELRYEKYAALLDAGFTKEEALAIVIQTPIMG